MNKIEIVFQEFVKTLEDDRNKRKYVSQARSFFEEIKEHSDEIKHPVDLEELLRSSKTKKEKKRDLILMFYDYLKEKTGKEIESDLKSKIIIDDSLERKIAIIQYMQANPIDIEKISDLFMISTKSMGRILNELEEGVDILGTKVKIKMDRKGWNRYSVISHHPVFLNLTMSEVVALTVGLVDAAKDNDLYAPLFKKIARDVYANLTDYGKGCIARMPANQDFFSEEIHAYEEQISSSLITMMKEECKGTIQIHSDGKDYVFTSCRVLSFDNHTITLMTRDGKEKVFSISDVYGCESHYGNRFE